MSKSKKSTSPPPVSPVEGNKKKFKLWIPLLIIGGLLFFVVLGFISFIGMDMISAAKKQDTTQKIESPSTPEPIKNDPAKNIPKSNTNTTTGDLSKMIPGSWYETDHIIDGRSAAKNGTLAKVSWLFYDDGSLKFTTTEYADLGTWNIQNDKFNVSLYGSGRRDGYISDISSNSMIWVSTENKGGKNIIVTRHLKKKK